MNGVGLPGQPRQLDEPPRVRSGRSRRRQPGPQIAMQQMEILVPQPLHRGSIDQRHSLLFHVTSSSSSAETEIEAIPLVVDAAPGVALVDSVRVEQGHEDAEDGEGLVVGPVRFDLGPLADAADQLAVGDLGGLVSAPRGNVDLNIWL